LYPVLLRSARDLILSVSVIRRRGYLLTYLAGKWLFQEIKEGRGI